MRDKLIKSEVIKLFNTTKETLRYYEKEGLISPEVDDRNYRYYDLKEMRTLRQILMFRDLGFSIEEMKLMLAKDENLNFLSLLESHQMDLKNKIQHYKRLEKDVDQVIALLKSDIFTLSFSIRSHKRRTFLVFNPFETAFVDSLKKYYDSFKSFIELEHYTEKSMITYYDYESLSNFTKEDVLMGIEVHEPIRKLTLPDKVACIELPTGRYLSIFYIFEEGKFHELTHLKGDIDKYLCAQGIILDHQKVLEIERPEFSILLDENKMLYELQIKIK